MPDPNLFLFVSHIRDDRQAALEIVDELERRGVSCWIAPRDVRPGKPFDDEIAEAIEGSRALLLIFSDHCNEHEYIRREITVAGESHKVIIPFRIEDAQPRHGLRVRLSDLHWIDGFVSRERAIDQVVRAIDPARVQQQEEERRRAEGERRQREEEQQPYQEEERREQALPRVQREFDQKQEEKEQPQRRRLFLHRPAGAIFVIAGVLVLLVPVVVWMLVFRQISGPPMATLAAPSPAPEGSVVEALQKSNQAYERKDYAEAMSAVPPDALFKGCTNLGSLRSVVANQSITLTFLNKTKSPIKITWINYNGGHESYGSLEPDQSVNQQTYTTHPWLITDTSGHCLGAFVASQSQEVVIRSAGGSG